MTKEQQTRANEISKRLEHLAVQQHAWEKSTEIREIKIISENTFVMPDASFVDFRLVKALAMVNILSEILNLETEYKLL